MHHENLGNVFVKLILSWKNTKWNVVTTLQFIGFIYELGGGGEAAGGGSIRYKGNEL